MTGNQFASALDGGKLLKLFIRSVTRCNMFVPRFIHRQFGLTLLVDKPQEGTARTMCNQ